MRMVFCQECGAQEAYDGMHGRVPLRCTACRLRRTRLLNKLARQKFLAGLKAARLSLRSQGVVSKIELDEQNREGSL